ncbi:hypothetical protein VTK56DRAFT_5908 [Thermocarpiscus australiensis]
MVSFIQQRIAAHNFGRSLPESTPREYMLRLTDSAPWKIDEMHEVMRKHPRTVEKKAGDYKLWQMFDNAQYQNCKEVYTYDFGDNWAHYMTVTGRAEPTRVFKCLSGSGQPVAEDAGGFQG